MTGFVTSPSKVSAEKFPSDKGNHICAHTYTRTYTHAHTHSLTCTHIHTHTNTHTHTQTHTLASYSPATLH